MIIGAQLYTIRNSCKTLNDLDESLKKVADIGYKSVQLSGICPYDPEWMAERLSAYGLTCDITHFDHMRYVNETADMIRRHDIIGCKYMGIGGFSSIFNEEYTDEKLAFNMELIGSCVKAIKQAGHKFMYHNHNREFTRLSDGRTLLEHICDWYPADEFGITLDTYWVQAGGADPAEWIRKLEGRVDCAHFKDMDYNMTDGKVRMLPIGEGNMNYDAIIKACVDTGVKYAYIEQDECNGEDPFDCLQRSFNYFRTLGLC